MPAGSLRRLSRPGLRGHVTAPEECPSGSVLDDLMFTMKSELDSKRFNGKAVKKKKFGPRKGLRKASFPT